MQNKAALFLKWLTNYRRFSTTCGSSTPLLGVSRMKGVDNSFQCCIEDGSRPTAYAVQTEYANHLKVL